MGGDGIGRMAVGESQEGLSMTGCGMFCREEVFWPDDHGKQHCLHPGSYYSIIYLLAGMIWVVLHVFVFEWYLFSFCADFLDY